ncbi:MAG: T9SS type A sorting domain-containing protein [candidate division Zixibacteria bacterium]|nr:T9SS type A sorting domain-containing protein [candidate division Zixibacteria bacterium]
MMRIYKVRSTTMWVALSIFFLSLVNSADSRPRVDSSGKAVSTSSSSLAATSVTDAIIDANRVFSYVTNLGTFARDNVGTLNLSGGGGVVFPYDGMANIANGTANKTAVFAAGVWLGGVDRATGDTLLTISEFSEECVPGPMKDGTFQPDNPTFRVYKLYRDSLADNPNQDYLDWPVSQGAPVDLAGNPKIWGAQTLWCVYNDADFASHGNDAGGTLPIGIEVQQTMWGFDPPEKNDTIAFRSKISAQHLSGTSAGKVTVDVVDVSGFSGHSYIVVFEENETLGQVWHLINITTGDTALANQTNQSGGGNYEIVDGLQVFVVANALKGLSSSYAPSSPLNVSPVAAADNGYSGDDRWFTGGNHGGELLFGGIFMEPNFWGATTVLPADYKTVEIRFRPMISYTDLTGDGEYTTGEPYVVDDPGGLTQSAFMYQTFAGSAYQGFNPIPFTAWDINDPANPRQLNVVVRDRDANGQWDLHSDLSADLILGPLLPNGGDQQFNYTWILDTDYDPTGTYYGDGTGGTIDFFSAQSGVAVWDAMWMMWLDERGSTRGPLAEESSLILVPGFGNSPADTFAFTAPAFEQIVTTNNEANAFYIRYKLINKGSKTLDSFYISLWSDPDLGGFTDDLVGCDPEDDLFYCYNATNNDAVYSSRPPAFACKLLEGPIVPSAGETAIVNGLEVSGFRNLNMYSFFKYINGTDPDSPTESFRYMTGVDGKTGLPMIDPTNEQPTRYFGSGDPVTGTGFLDHDPSDRRMMGSAGPFTFNPGDTQYVTWKLAFGHGTDRLTAITKAREILNRETDSDLDKIAYYADNCPNEANFDQLDTDNDGVGDACDNCVDQFNPDQADSNNDGIGDACLQTDVSEYTGSTLPRVFALYQNYPNPFNPSTKFKLDLPIRSEWKITVYNVLGQAVETFSGNSPAGTIVVDWDASDFASGIYFARAQAGSFSASQKMMLLK